MIVVNINYQIFTALTGEKRRKRYIKRNMNKSSIRNRVTIPESCRKRFSGKAHVNYSTIPDPYSYTKEMKARAENEFQVPLYIPNRWYFYRLMKKGVRFPLTGLKADISSDYFISEYGL